MSKRVRHLTSFIFTLQLEGRTIVALKRYTCNKVPLNCLLVQTFLLWLEQATLATTGLNWDSLEVPDKGISTTESYLKFITLWILRNHHWDHWINLPEKDFAKTTKFLGTTEHLTLKNTTIKDLLVINLTSWILLPDGASANQKKSRLQTEIWLLVKWFWEVFSWLLIKSHSWKDSRHVHLFGMKLILDHMMFFPQIWAKVEHEQHKQVKNTKHCTMKVHSYRLGSKELLLDCFWRWTCWN